MRSGGPLRRGKGAYRIWRDCANDMNLQQLLTDSPFDGKVGRLCGCEYVPERDEAVAGGRRSRIGCKRLSRTCRGVKCNVELLER